MTQAEIMGLTERYVMKTYSRLPLAIVRGQGTKVWDADGREYLDFVTGLAVNGLGHCHPRVVKAIEQAAHTLLHCSNLYHIEPQAQLARLLVEKSGLGKAFFCNSGAEANEAAIKLARRYAKVTGRGERYEIVTAERSFHGRTLATVTATGQEKYHKGFEPLPAGFRYVPFGDLAALEEAITPTTCAVMLEPVQGEGGVYPSPPGYLEGVRRLCDQHGLLLILDEVQTGMGRTGRLFAFQHFGIRPDILTLAKSLAGGVPIGAMLATDEAARGFEPGSHASTFGGNPLATSAALATLAAMEEEGLVERAAAMGTVLKEALASLRTRHPYIGEIRGLGLMVGMDLTIPAGRLVAACMERGLLVNVIADRTVRLLPPLTVSEGEIRQAVSILDEALAAIAQSAA